MATSTEAIPGPTSIVGTGRVGQPRPNPFARPSAPRSPSSFTRTSLLPTLRSPVKSSTVVDPLSTPADRLITKHFGNTGSNGKTRQSWRLLWRGGLEIGKDGWRLDGITFFALLTFATDTPSNSTPNNTFDAPIQPFGMSGTPGAGGTTSPFTLPAGDTDLCLSLESMRGRKYLQVRGVVDLPESEELDGSDDSGGVQMSIAPSAPLLAGYFAGLLCRQATLSPSGRTLHAVLIGLGDDIDSAGSTVLVYGQRSESDAGYLRLCVARRKSTAPPASAKKIRPGEPLPRPPLFFPTKAPKKPTMPFPRARTLSRAPSTSSIYRLPPTSLPPQPAPSLAPAPVSGRTPGRRGEKRQKKDDEKDDERRRKAGRIVPDSSSRSNTSNGSKVNKAQAEPNKDTEGGDEDIFGKTASSIARPLPKLISAIDQSGEQSSAKKRTRVSQQVLDNKAAIRKQTMVLLEERGVARTHEAFKDIFGMTTKGTYFAFRDVLEHGPLLKTDIQRIIRGHLDIYLISQVTIAHPSDYPVTPLKSVKEEEELVVKEEKSDGLVSIKEEDEEDDQVKFEREPLSEGVLSEGPMSEGPLSDGPLSEGPMSDGPYSEGNLSEEVIMSESDHVLE